VILNRFLADDFVFILGISLLLIRPQGASWAPHGHFLLGETQKGEDPFSIKRWKPPRHALPAGLNARLITVT
jgi:hypothetical protein